MRFSVIMGAVIATSAVLFGATRGGAGTLEWTSTDGVMEQYASAAAMPGSRPSVSSSEALTWGQAAKEALRHNPSLLESQLYVEQAREQVAIGDAGFFPIINANVGMNRGAGEQIFNGTRFKTSSGTYEGGLTGTWNLFDGFATLATHEQNVALVQNRKAAYDQASTALYLSLGQAFDQLIYDQQNLVLLKVLVDRYHSDTLYQQQEFKGGLTALWTYEKAQSDEAGEVWYYNQQRYSLMADKATLAVLLGHSGDTADGLVASGHLTVTAAPDDYHVDLKRMLDINPTLTYYQTLAKEDDAALWAAESTRYPSVGASGSMGISGGETWGPPDKEWQAGLSVSYELFAGGGPEAAITQADEALRQAQVSVTDERHQLQAAFVRAWIAYATGWQRLPSASMAVRAGTDRFATVGALYQTGREEFLDYEQAESIYSGAQTQQLSVLLAAAEAQVAYRNAMGVTLEQAADGQAP